MNKGIYETFCSRDGEGIKDRDLEKELDSLKRLAHWLDDCLRVPGTEWKIGADGVIGSIPIVGDIATGCLAAYIIYQARRFNAPRGTLFKMISNSALDMGVGFIPVVGDLFDFYWKANLSNLNLLIHHIECEGYKNKSDISSRQPNNKR